MTYQPLEYSSLSIISPPMYLNDYSKYKVTVRCFVPTAAVPS